ncbi:FolC bifunctional protein [Trichoderma citrinoviride]|uniref:Folylpolyglutamate synthase n=1 Tax=Trichoderma citrinoviride TaxID=58853 RepID=A0A2T4BG49_9HYPO|nr:FolC bifunctional protein [Trichoderma citrinoviride]PTB68248.1 FolC bifunctional protein [Trichoderma citrinoviride]
MASSGRSYNACLSLALSLDAIDKLNELQTPFAVIEARRKAGILPDSVLGIAKMRTYLTRIGYTPADLDRLNIVHVAGTKGKGSTCAFVDSILSQYQQRPNGGGGPRKTGLFTSPHLMAVRERIRIDSRPISEELFAKYFFQVWDRLEESRDAPDEDTPFGSKPVYARYLTLVSWHAFLQEGVEVAVYETGIGGEYDSTNLVKKPVASGISTLGIDHVAILGDTVEKIAWHKAGIMKTGCPAFTIEQLPGAKQVLLNRAKEKNVDLKVLKIDPRLEGVKIRPNAVFQKKNATLAIALAETVLTKLGLLKEKLPQEKLPQEFVDGLEKCVFRGRCEVKQEKNVIWHLDGAHTADSLKMSSKWFASEIAGRTGPRVMIFNQQGRIEAIDFLQPICTTLKALNTSSSASASASNEQQQQQQQDRPAFDHVVFCTNVTYAQTGYKRDFVNNTIDPAEVDKLTVQRAFADKWSAIDPQAKVVVLPTIEDALNYAREVARSSLPEAEAAAGEDKDSKVLVYVTGSLHLVGGALGILEETDAL